MYSNIAKENPYFPAVNKDPFIHISDQELLDRYYSGRNNDWLGVLLERYTLLLLGVCMKYLKNEEEAKDSVQQIFVKVITELPRFKVIYFKSWIYTVARNYCLMKLRDRHEKVPAEITESMMATYDEEPVAKTHQEKDQLLEWMTESLEELGKEQKLCVTLFYLEKKSYQEIIDLTKFTPMQVKSHIQNGKRNLKLLLEKKRKR